jgi:hypothetical protein
MSHVFVFASAESRLHADLLVVRLKQAGVALEAISLLYPSALQPNTARCWLSGSGKFSLSDADEIAGSGRFGSPEDFEGTGDTEKLEKKLSRLGLAPEQRASIKEILCEGRIVIAIEAHNKDDLHAIFDTFGYVGVENSFTARRNVSARLAA